MGGVQLWPPQSCGQGRPCWWPWGWSRVFFHQNGAFPPKWGFPGGFPAGSQPPALGFVSFSSCLGLRLRFGCAGMSPMSPALWSERDTPALGGSVASFPVPPWPWGVQGITPGSVLTLRLRVAKILLLQAWQGVASSHLCPQGAIPLPGEQGGWPQTLECPPAPGSDPAVVTQGTQDEVPDSGGPSRGRIPVAPRLPPAGAAILRIFHHFRLCGGSRKRGKETKFGTGSGWSSQERHRSCGTARSGTGTPAWPGMVTPQTRGDPTNSG